MKELQDEYGMSIIMITHDLGVIAEVTDRVVVMYAGKVVEYADVHTLFKEPRHPYSWGLMNAIPRLDEEKEKLYNIPGVVPDPLDFPEGCRFNTRCPFATDKCKTEEPPLEEVEEKHFAACWHIDKLLEEIKRIREGESA
jgi:peptide/nickel transport system ATP-binding protein